jgi:hypothetical protein
MGKETISFVVLDDKSANQAADLAAKTGVRGMDALLIQVAKEFGTELISFDEEMMGKLTLISKHYLPFFSDPLHPSNIPSFQPSSIPVSHYSISSFFS